MPEAERSRRIARNAGSTFAQGAAVSGKLVTDGPVAIDGDIDGDVHGRTVTIGPKATVKGSIHAETVAIAGRVDGLIKAATVSVSKGARLEGEINCESLTVEDGADLAVRCSVRRENVY